MVCRPMLISNSKLDLRTEPDMAVTATLDNLGFQANPDASEPLYVQLTVALADAIRTGRI